MKSIQKTSPSDASSSVNTLWSLNKTQKLLFTKLQQEIKRGGSFKCIFPTNTSYKYFNFFEEVSDEGDRVIARTEARIGQIIGDVSEISNNIKGANFSLNKLFGGFQITVNSGNRGYFFKPNQTIKPQYSTNCGKTWD